MPITIDEFDAHDPGDGATNAERVVRFLAANRDKAYRAAEIADAADVNENSIHPVLGRLEARGLVRHKEPYWTLGDPERVQDAFRLHSTVEFLNETLGPESREEWLAAAEEGRSGTEE